MYRLFVAFITRRVTRDRGASLVEYALLIALIAAVCILAVTFLGTTASSEYETNTSSLFL